MTANSGVLGDLELHTGASPGAGEFGGWTGELGEERGLTEHFIASDQEEAGEGKVEDRRKLRTICVTGKA